MSPHSGSSSHESSSESRDPDPEAMDSASLFEIWLLSSSSSELEYVDSDLDTRLILLLLVYQSSVKSGTLSMGISMDFGLHTGALFLSFPRVNTSAPNQFRFKLMEGTSRKFCWTSLCSHGATSISSSSP